MLYSPTQMKKGKQNFQVRSHLKQRYSDRPEARTSSTTCPFFWANIFCFIVTISFQRTPWPDSDLWVLFPCQCSLLLLAPVSCAGDRVGRGEGRETSSKDAAIPDTTREEKRPTLERRATMIELFERVIQFQPCFFFCLLSKERPHKHLIEGRGGWGKRTSWSSWPTMLWVVFHIYLYIYLLVSVAVVVCITLLPLAIELVRTTSLLITAPHPKGMCPCTWEENSTIVGDLFTQTKLNGKHTS